MDFKKLLAIHSVSHLDQQAQVDHIGTIFDMSLDHESLAGIEKGFLLANEINQADLKPILLTGLFYNLSNGWSYKRKIKYRKSTDGWQFQMEELSLEIIYLRKALASEGFVEVMAERQCEIYTNLGNAFFLSAGLLRQCHTGGKPLISFPILQWQLRIWPTAPFITVGPYLTTYILTYLFAIRTTSSFKHWNSSI